MNRGLVQPDTTALLDQDAQPHRLRASDGCRNCGMITTPNVSAVAGKFSRGERGPVLPSVDPGAADAPDLGPHLDLRAPSGPFRAGRARRERRGRVGQAAFRCRPGGPVPRRAGGAELVCFGEAGASSALMRPLILVALWASTPHAHHVWAPQEERRPGPAGGTTTGCRRRNDDRRRRRTDNTQSVLSRKDGPLNCPGTGRRCGDSWGARFPAQPGLPKRAW